MAERATFAGLDPYKLTGVRVTDRKLGHGSYATVLELEYIGLKYAGKKIHELLLEQEDASYIIHRFEEECRLLSQVRHPNIVQFLGVYFQQLRMRVPILVMEFLPTNLTSCIEQYGILPKEISYSILHDVALGLCYLHSHTPPIVHRDLSSNNFLLTPNMTAKISDLGVARILNLTPLQVSRITQTPGTPAYMPPEVMIANPKYDTSVDEFSYGIMMIHMFSGQWPEPQVGPSRIEGGKLIPVTEAERREKFFEAIEDGHPLMDLIRRCINNDPQLRPHADEVIRQVSRVASQFPASFANRLEMLRQLETVEEEKRALTEEGQRKDRAVQQKENQISSLREEVRAKEEQKSEEIDRLKLAHSSEVEQFRLQVRDLNTENQLVTAKMEAEVAELKSNAAVYKSQIETVSRAQFQEREQFKQMIAEQREQSELQLVQERELSKLQLSMEREQAELQLAKEREQLQLQLAQEREANKKLMADNQNLQSNLSKVKSENTNLLCTISELQADSLEKDSVIKMKDTATKRKESELEAKSRALGEKDATISAMSEQITKTREYLATTKQQVSS